MVTKLNDNDFKHVEFVIYCIELYKDKKGIASGKEAYSKLKDSGAVYFIDNHYDTLHFAGDNDIIWNIDEYIGG